MTIAILGCGWLGLPLARRLVAGGHAVRGSTTSPDRLPDLQSAGIEGRVLDLDAVGERALAVWCEADALVVTVPPSGLADYPGAMRRVASVAPRRIVFTSSTSVYPDGPGEATEAGPRPDASLSPRGATVWATEVAMRDVASDRLVVLRLAGLVGDDRQPGRFLAGRTDLPRPQAPVNLLHRRDAVEAVREALAAPVGAYAVCAPAHPTRRAFYAAEARRLGLEPPTFRDDATLGKTISAAPFERATGWTASWRPGEPV